MHLTEKELTTVVSEKMKGLPEDAIREVMDFIEFLISKKDPGKRGSPEAILKSKNCASTGLNPGIRLVNAAFSSNMRTNLPF